MASISDFIKLIKPSITLMQVVTLSWGYFLGLRYGDGFHFWVYFYACLGTTFVAAGACALNQYLERGIDARMNRTAQRPVVTGAISPNLAVFLGVALCLVGGAILVFQVNAMTGVLSALTALLYVLVYTPLKQFTWLNTLVGAIPGAILPLGGWMAASGGLKPEAWILFGLLFAWQIPHFYAIAWLYKDEYREAGLKMLPSMDETGKRTAFQVLLYSFGIVAISLVWWWLGSLNTATAVTVTILGLVYAGFGVEFAFQRSRASAKRLLRCSIIYLPLILLTMSLEVF